MVTLTAEQKTQVSRWIDEGLKLAEIQDRLRTAFGLSLTYMDLRLLVADLKLVPKDTVRVDPAAMLAAAAPPPAGAKPGSAPAPAPASRPGAKPAEPAGLPSPAPGAGNVSVSVDTVTRPGTALSGRVTFSDGQKAAWFMDPYGQLGLAAEQKGYKPSPADLRSFQQMLEAQLSQMGY